MIPISRTHTIETLSPLRTAAFVCFSALAFFAVTGSANAGSLVSNGSFELSSQATSGAINGGGNPLTDWGTSAGLIYLITPGTGGNFFHSTPGNSPDGGNFIAEDGDPNFSGPLTQSINGLVVGQTYHVSFYQAAAQLLGYTGATTEQWQVALGGDTQSSALMTNPSESSQPWTQQTLTFTANSVSEVLSFMAVGTPAGEPPDALLDGVSFTSTATPEPAALMLTGVGLLLVVIGRQRRKRA
jgi:Protein of unknown function (DUF642)